MNFSLQDKNGRQIGFLVMLADENLPTQGQCIVKLMLAQENMINSNAAVALKKLEQQGMFQWQFDGQKTLLTDHSNLTIGIIREHFLTIDGTVFIMTDLTGIV